MPGDGLSVLCLGFSRIVQRRVLPALERVAGVARVEIASRRGEPDREHLPAKVGGCHDGFAAGLETGPDLVYVSTVNSEHAEWTERALEHGCHVIVDKPSFIRLGDAERLTALAAERRSCLAEATVYAAHPQIELCRQTFADAGTRPTKISALFSMPPLAPDNFRYRAELGGGALWDLGPYAVSLGRLFFESEPTAAHCQPVPRGETEVETAFSVLVSYPEGRSLSGHFGFDTEYRNEVTLLGAGAAVRVERIFTTPPELDNERTVHAGNRESRRRAPAADSFTCFLEDVVGRVRSGEGFTELGERLLQDARALAALRRAAGVS